MTSFRVFFVLLLQGKYISFSQVKMEKDELLYIFVAGSNVAITSYTISHIKYKFSRKFRFTLYS